MPPPKRTNTVTTNLKRLRAEDPGHQRWWQRHGVSMAQPGADVLVGGRLAS